MAGLLRVAKLVVIGAMCAVGAFAGSGLLARVVPVSASTTVTGAESTGYAFGSLTGASPGELTWGHFANHSSAYCSGDPAAYWPYGTWIHYLSPQPYYHDYNYNTIYYTWQSLKDIGDFGCTRSAYWVDFYFGRYKWTSLACSCNNATEVCYNTSTVMSNCSDASGWGLRTQGYTKE